MARAGRISTLVAWNPSRGERCGHSVAELLASDSIVIGAALAGLALTALGILRDLGTFRLEKIRAATASAQVESA
jgi:hypothetical protein